LGGGIARRKRRLPLKLDPRANPVYSVCMKTRFFLAAALAAGIFFACAGADFTRKPTAEISRFDIDSISLRDITFVFDVTISNSYPIGLNLDALKMDFFVEEKKAFSTTTSGGMKIPARGKETTTFLVSLNYADVIGIVSDYAKKDYLSTVIKTEIVIPLPDVPGLPPSLSFSYDLEKRIPAVKPRISIANFHVKQPTSAEIAAAAKAAGKAAAAQTLGSALSSLLSGSKSAASAQPASLADVDLPLTVSFDIELENQTAAKLEFANLDYDFLVNGNPLVKGLAKDITRKGNVSVVSVVNRFSTKGLTSAIINAFTSGKGDFSLAGGTAVKFPDEIRKTPVPLKFTETGKFNLR
jgi:hypothetical protein